MSQKLREFLLSLTWNFSKRWISRTEKLRQDHDEPRMGNSYYLNDLSHIHTSCRWYSMGLIWGGEIWLLDCKRISKGSYSTGSKWGCHIGFPHLLDRSSNSWNIAWHFLCQMEVCYKIDLPLRSDSAFAYKRIASRVMLDSTIHLRVLEFLSRNALHLWPQNRDGDSCHFRNHFVNTEKGHVKQEFRFLNPAKLPDNIFGWTHHTNHSFCHELHCTASAAASAANEWILQLN